MSNIITLKEEAKLEIYNYFDKHIRVLPKDGEANFNEMSGDFIDNDVDALRHAYVSGVYTILKVSGEYLVEELSYTVGEVGPKVKTNVGLRCYYFIPNLND